MNIKLTNKPKSDITFFFDMLLNEFVINSPKYKIDIYRGIDWSESKPWHVCNQMPVELKYKGELYAKDISSYIDILYTHNELVVEDDLDMFLDELYRNYNIEGVLTDEDYIE